MSRCGIIILAAGGSSRLGRPKQMLEFDGRNLLQRSIDVAAATRCRPIFVVLGAQYESLAAQIATEFRAQQITILHNPSWNSGIGSSIRVGVAAAGSCCDAAVLILCDQPFVTAAGIDDLVARREASGKLICAAAYNGTLGTPAVFGAALFGELMDLADRQGGKAVIQRYADQVEAMDMREAAIDIDTESDFKQAVNFQEQMIIKPGTKANPDSTQ